MVKILLGPERKAKKSKPGRAPFSFVTSSPLALPRTCPTITLTDLPYLMLHDDSEADKGLSEMFSESGFPLVAGIKNGGCYIDSHSQFTSYAIGARIDLLERRFGAGWYLLNLLESCPIALWTPNYMYDHAKESFRLDFTKCTSDWIWEKEPSERKQKMSRHLLPNNLQKLCADVEAVELDARNTEGDGEYPDEECYHLPAIVLSWWDNIHWYNGQCLRNPTFTMEHGTNPAYAIMDSYAEQTYQDGSTHMGSPIYHDLDQARRIVELAKPYAKLIKYLSHDTKECGFNCF